MPTSSTTLVNLGTVPLKVNVNKQAIYQYKILEDPLSTKPS